MAIIQSKEKELRYLKHQNLESEAKIISNYYRDIIHSYGVDCTYYKSEVDLPPSFNKVLTSNNILKQAYGYDTNIKFELSSHLITFSEISEDIFILDKLGNENPLPTTFYFDSTEFATSFMTKLGQYKEYKFKSQEVSGQIIDNKITFTKEFSSDILSGEVFCDTYVTLDAGYPSDDYNNQHFIVDGGNATPKNSLIKKVYSDENSDYDIANCSIKSHTIPVFKLPVNKFIAKSFDYEALDGEVAIISYFKYHLAKDKDGNQLYEDNNPIFIGTLDGTVLYYDLTLISNYIYSIKPTVGDIIELDTSFGNVVYEVTDVKNQELTENGINPLVFKYIYKISAMKRINSYEKSAPEEKSTTINKEILNSEALTTNNINKLIYSYNSNEDLIYGGFKGTAIDDMYKSISNTDETSWDASELSPGPYMNIMDFGNNTVLLTDGINLYFKKFDNSISKLSLFTSNITKSKLSGIPTSMRYLKATNNNIYFQNMDGNITTLLKNDDFIDINTRTISTIKDINDKNDNFYKFPNCKVLLFSTPNNLYVKTEDSDKIIALA